MARPKANKTKTKTDPAADLRSAVLQEADPMNRLQRHDDQRAKAPETAVPVTPEPAAPKTAHEMATARLQKARGL